VYASEAVVHHAHALTLRTLWRQHFGYGRAAYAVHRMRAARQPGGIRFEPVRFYAGLIARPFTDGAPRPWSMAALIGVTQAANAAGLFSEAARRGRPRL